MTHRELPPPEPGYEITLVNRGGELSAAPVYRVQGPEPLAEAEPASGTLLYYSRLLTRHKGKLLAFAVAGALIGYFVTLPQTRTYRARTSLEFQPVNENFLNMRDVSPTSDGSYSPEVDLQTQVKILQSESLLDRVASKLSEGNASPERIALLRDAARSLKIRAHANTRIIEALVVSPDPRLAADFANTLASVYADKNLEARWQTTQHTGEWLTRQMQELRVKLQASEDQLQKYARASGLQFTAEKDNVAEEKLRQLQQELSRAQAERIARQSRYELASSSSPEALPEVLDSETLRSYQVKLADLRRESAELSATLTPAHPKVLKIEAQAASLQATLDRERGNIVRRIRNEYEAAKRRESLLGSDYAAHARLMSEQAGRISHYNLLKREVDSTRQIYESMLQKVKEAGIASALRASNIRVIDPATPPLRPYRPSMALNVAGGLLGALLLGFVIVVVRDRDDHSIQEPGQAAPYLKASEIGVIPSTQVTRVPALAAAAAAGGVKRPASLLLAPHKPSMFADSFRAAATSILLAGDNGKHPRVLVVASANPGEGKTTVACNLAMALAEVNRKVLLIDGDMRKPRLHEIFGVDNRAGLAEFLADGQDAVAPVPTGVKNLALLPSGSGRHTHLLYSPRLNELIEAVRQQADFVLIDTPPMLQMPEARVLGRCADGVVLVVRAGQTTVEAAVIARQRFAEDGTAIFGTILNDWNPKSTSAYGYRHYYNSYNRYQNTKA